MSGPRLLDRRTDGVDDPRPDGAHGSGVDPRFRERRIAVRKDAGRKRLKRLVLLVAVAAVALAGVVVVRSPVLDVDEITVTGTAQLTTDQIVDVAGIGRGSPLLLADLDAAASELEALPWVAAAEVTRDLPGRVRIAVRERDAVAVVAGPGRAVLVDVEGRVLEVADAAATPFVQVVVADDPPEPGRDVGPDLVAAIELAGRLRVNPAGAVAAVLLEPTLRLELVDGGVADFGDATDLDAKVEAFRTVHARVDRSCLAVVDLAVATHPVLTRTPGC